jgi:8-oxo-dGTP pyrophosphatase MutT (NUDIX family)
MQHFVSELEEKMKRGLPGRNAQLQMAPSVRKHYMEAPETASTASVLALFYPKDEQNHLVLIERQTKKNDRHGGQISLPGGKTEPHDSGHDQTALREAEEEVGVKSEDVELIGSLTELYIPVSNFRVFPFVGFMDYRPDFVPQLSEVKSILEIPFERFLEQNARKTMDMQVSQHVKMRSVPYFDVSGQIVWGATAMILSELVSIANQ